MAANFVMKSSKKLKEDYFPILIILCQQERPARWYHTEASFTLCARINVWGSELSEVGSGVGRPECLMNLMH
jgi:hypothetical protein